MSLLASLTTDFTVTAALGAVLLDHEIPTKLSALVDTSIYWGPANRKAIALTFDDGPSPQTPAVLEVLAQHGVRGTFFQTGLQVDRYPEIARRVSAAGHEIANHGWSHRSLKPRLRSPVSVPSLGLLHKELAQTQRVLRAVHGGTPRWFRPPFGHRWLPLDLVARSMGLRSVQWSVIGHDWEWTADRITARILEQTRPGAILCLHDGRDVQPTADLAELLDALGKMIPALLEAGYEFVSLSDMFSAGAPQAGGVPEAEERGRPYGRANLSASSTLVATSRAALLPRSMPSSSQTSRKARSLS